MSFFTGFLTNRRWAFEEMFRGLKRNAGANAFAVLLSALALTIPLWIALVFYGLSEPLRSLPTSVELTVFTKEGADAVKVANAVRAAPLVTSAQVIGKDEALKALNAQLGLPSQTAGGNPLPDIIVAVLDDRASADEIAAAAKRISALPGVDFAPYEASWHEKLRAVTQASWVGLACLGTVVALLVILVLESAVRMTTASARDEMCTLYLIGAAPGFAARPYAWRGMVLMGTVRNVIDFGVFVDIGVHQDGLVHISQVSQKFIKHPSEVVSVGDIVQVVVLEVDEKKKRIGLSMKQVPKA